jgi:hypothetical protein
MHSQRYVSTKKERTMKASVLLFALIALVLGWTIYALSPSVRHAAPDARAGSLPPPTGSGGRDNLATDDLGGLKQDMALMQSDLASVRAVLTSLAAQVQSAALSPASRGASPNTRARFSHRASTPTRHRPATRGQPAERVPHDEPPAVDFPAHEDVTVEETATLQETGLEAIEATLRHEPIDATWAAHAADTIDQAIGNNTLDGSILHDLECRSTLCRVEVTNQDPQARFAFELQFLIAVAQLLPRATLRTVENQDGSSSTVLYLARDGHDFPQLTD